MAYVTTETLRSRLALAERDEPSAVFGGTLRLCELTRAQYLACRRAADLGDRATLTRTPDGQLVRLTMDPDRWNASLLAAGIVDGATGQPLWPDADAVLALPNRAAVRDEVLRLASAILDLSEVGPGALKSGGPADDAG